MTKFSVNIFIFNWTTNVSLVVLLWSIFFNRPLEQIFQETRLSNQIRRMYQGQQNQTSQQPCTTGQITMMKFNEDKCKQSTETKNQIHKCMMIKILIAIYIKGAQTNADSKLNRNRYCDIETIYSQTTVLEISK